MLASSIALIALAGSASAAAVPRAEPIGVVLAGAPINDLNITAAPLPLAQCAPVNISFSGGEPPYRLKIGTGGYYVESTWLYEYDNLTSSPFEWVVNATTNTSLNFQLYDATNATKNVQNLVVGPGNATCFNATVPGNTTSTLGSSATASVPTAAQ